MSCMIRKSLSRLPDFLTVDDLVDIGLYPSQGSFAGAQHRGHAPEGVRVGSRLIFHREAVIEFVLSNLRKPVDKSKPRDKPSDKYEVNNNQHMLNFNG